MLDERRLRRAGLDYREWVDVREHDSLDVFQQRVRPPRLFALSSRAKRNFFEQSYRRGDAFLFGPETRGLPRELLQTLPESLRLRIPMRPGNRSLNLSNAVAIACYEAWRQCAFEVGDETGDGERCA